LRSTTLVAALLCPNTNIRTCQLQHSLRSASLELSLAQSKHSVEAVARDEEIRKLRLSQCLLENDNSDLHEQLEEEQARSDELENALDDALLNLDEQKAESEVAQNQIRTQSREIANLKVGLTSPSTTQSPLTPHRPN
jgi:predicted RNase H-like nuclease (RuvC/YqgF family)